MVEMRGVMIIVMATVKVIADLEDLDLTMFQ